MAGPIGIRREDKNKWERRTPLVPADLADLEKRYNLPFLVQPSPIRVFRDEEFRSVGAAVQENLDSAPIVLGIKEVPTQLLRQGRIYVYFAHVIKGQHHNMPMLQRLMDLGCSLVDYERIVDEKGARLIFFGVHAGYAGMVETLRGLGQRLLSKGVKTPFTEVRHAFEYETLEKAKAHLREIGKQIDAGGLPESLRPLTIGVTGYGNVSRGVQEILSCLPVKEVSVADLPKEAARGTKNGTALLKVVFKEENLVSPAKAGGVFALQDYYQHPEKYVGCFETYLPHLDVLMNTIYWDDRYPRLVTRDWVKKNYAHDRQPRLQMIGDISCDLEGSIEVTLDATAPDAPCFTYDPVTDSVRPGHDGVGPTVMAVDNLPCEFPRESSEWFSHVLREMIGPLAAADWNADFDKLILPEPLKKAVIVHRGKLTPSYSYLEKHLHP
jgi:saccharopine dehydrogenase (NAD+, L-lysine forming)